MVWSFQPFVDDSEKNFCSNARCCAALFWTILPTMLIARSQVVRILPMRRCSSAGGKTTGMSENLGNKASGDLS